MRTCNFYVRHCDSIHDCILQCVWYGNSVHMSVSVRPSVTRVDFIKTAEHIIEIISLSDRPMTLVFITKGC